MTRSFSGRAKSVSSKLATLIPAGLMALAGCDPSATEDLTVPAVETVRVQVPVASETPFITGKLGTIELSALPGSGLRGRDAIDYSAPALSFLQDFARKNLNAIGDEEFVARSVFQDDRGNVAIRFDQFANGLRVYGAQLVVEADRDGIVRRVNGNFVPSNTVVVSPEISDTAAFARALSGAGIADARSAGDTELAYVLDNSGNAGLAWTTTVEYENAAGPQRDQIFADATTGTMLAVFPQFHYARSLNTQNCNNKTTNCSTVSTSSNPINTGDGAIDAAHNYAIATYNYYWNNYGRDSIDGAGMTLKNRAHYSNNYNNAFWDGTQMTYGDGDGTTFIPLSQDADVVAHELTHGVTERSSNLTYSGESGALNEAWSDIFGSEVDRQEGATGADIWLLGEDIYTPGTPGDGLRVMNDPAAAGDYDWYPTRYTGTSDNGGVHWNSGIANLAFTLLSDGGSHPRGKSSVVVPQIGHVAAARIFYLANVACMTASTNFQGARNCTVAKAANQAEADAVTAAWDAVGVPGGGGGGGGGTCGSGKYCDSWSGISGSRRSKTYFSQDVPSGATNLNIGIAGGSGDADLYVRFGAQPTTSTYDCRPYVAGNNELCSFASPSTGTYQIMLYGYAAYSGVTLSVDYIE